MTNFLFKKDPYNIKCILFFFEKRHETCRDMPSQHCLWLACRGSTQMLHRLGGSLCQGRQCSYGTSTSWTTFPLPTMWPYLSMYMLDKDATTDTTSVFTCEPCKPKTTIILTFFDFFLSSWEAYFFWHVNFLYAIIFHIHHMLIYLTLS